MDGIDRYEAKRIAEDEARATTAELRRDVERDIDALERGIRDLGIALRVDLDEVRTAISDLRTAE